MASTNKLNPIPHPPKKPVVGNMLSVDASAPVQDLVRLSKELGPIFWLDMMGVPMVIVSGAALVDELSDEKRFDKTVRGPLRRIRAIAGDGLFTADTVEPNWSKAHNILMMPFGNRAMQSYHPMMVDIADQLVKKWERLNGDEEIDVVHDMTALTLEQSACAVSITGSIRSTGAIITLCRLAGALARNHDDDPGDAAEKGCSSAAAISSPTSPS